MNQNSVQLEKPIFTITHIGKMASDEKCQTISNNICVLPVLELSLSLPVWCIAKILPVSVFYQPSLQLKYSSHDTFIRKTHQRKFK